MSAKHPIVILGEDREGIKTSLKKPLEENGISVWHCQDGITAFRRSFESNPDLIILDVNLPGLNGYQCARLLKNDPQMQALPIIHIGSSHNPIEQYWSRVCRGDGFIHRPIQGHDLEKIVHEFIQPTAQKPQLLRPSSIIPDLEDHSILSMAVNLLEQDLLRFNVLNEINMLEVSSVPASDIVVSVMAIIGSLHEFTTGAALLIFDFQGEFFFCNHCATEQNRIDNIKHLMINHLRDNHQFHLDIRQTKQTVIEGEKAQGRESNTDHVYIHTRDSGPVRSVMAFENLTIDDMSKDEQDILMLTLDLAHGVLEKKVFFRTSHQLSIIDATTEGYSMLFLMGVLKREIENAKRIGYPMSLLTIEISNFREITKTLNPSKENTLIRTIHTLIMKAMRKSDIAARWERASFAFLFSHTPLEKARIAQERISKYLQQEIEKVLPPSTPVKINHGGSQFDPEHDLSPEMYFEKAKPSNELKAREF